MKRILCISFALVIMANSFSTTATSSNSFCADDEQITVSGTSQKSLNEVAVSSLTTDKKTYRVGESISVDFTGSTKAKDWIGIYPATVTNLESVYSTLWSYVNGTKSATSVIENGKVTFSSGLTTIGKYTAYLCADDGYTILAKTDFEVSTTTNMVSVENSTIGIKAFPNPTKGILSIISTENNQVQISVKKADGREILNEKMDLKAGQAQTIDMANVPEGVYLLNIVCQSKLKTIKLVKN